MADWFQDIMNLDLNLGPVAPTTPAVEPGIELELEPTSGESRNVDRRGPPLEMNIPGPIDFGTGRQIQRALESRTSQRLRWRQIQRAFEERAVRMAVETHGDPIDFGAGAEVEDGGGTLQVGEGSVAPEERSCEVLKMCETNVTLLENSSVEAKEDVEKTGSESGSFFDCNICLDLSKEPVVTCCGHLFCWSCIYQWLHIHSDAKECPVCKGEVTLKTVTPIYGRGARTRDQEEDSDIKIPARPSASRVDSLRQTIQRTASLFPMEEVIRRLGNRFELNQDFLQLPEGESEPHSRPALLNSIMTTRARRREIASAGGTDDVMLNRMMTLQMRQLSGVPPENVVDLTQDRPETVPPRRVPTPLTYRRGQSHRSDSNVTPTDRILEAFFRRSPTVRSQEIQQPSSVDDRDSFSSIAAVDTAVEIDSLVSLSTSSSRRHDASRSSDMDSGDSRPLRRRRLN